MLIAHATIPAISDQKALREASASYLDSRCIARMARHGISVRWMGMIYKRLRQALIRSSTMFPEDCTPTRPQGRTKYFAVSQA